MANTQRTSADFGAWLLIASSVVGLCLSVVNYFWAQGRRLLAG